MIPKYTFFLHCNDRHLPNRMQYRQLRHYEFIQNVSRSNFSSLYNESYKYLTFTNQIVERNLSDGWYHYLRMLRTFSPASCICTQTQKNADIKRVREKEKNTYNEEGGWIGTSATQWEEKKIIWNSCTVSTVYSIRYAIFCIFQLPVSCVRANDKRPREKKRDLKYGDH